MLLLRTSAASNAPHLTLHHAYARLIDLKSQLRHLQAAAAAEAAQQLQEQLQAQRQQAQLKEAQAAEQMAEAQASSTSSHQDPAVIAAEQKHANDSPAAQQNQTSDDHQQHVSSLQPLPHQSLTKQPTGQSSNHLAANASVIGSPGTHLPPQPPAASPSTSKPAAAPVSLLTGKATQPGKQAPMGLLEIQAEQEAEAVKKAEASRAMTPGRHGKGKPRSEGSQSSRSAGAAQPGQPRVLQVGLSLSAKASVLAAQAVLAGNGGCLCRSCVRCCIREGVVQRLQVQSMCSWSDTMKGLCQLCICD